MLPGAYLYGFVFRRMEKRVSPFALFPLLAFPLVLLLSVCVFYPACFVYRYPGYCLLQYVSVACFSLVCSCIDRKGADMTGARRVCKWERGDVTDDAESVEPKVQIS